MNKTKKLITKCIGMNDLAQGLVRIGKDVIAVSNVLPGEEVQIELDTTVKYIKVQKTRVLKPSSKRVDAKCPIYDKCGGCQLLHLSYADQMEWKKNYVIDCYKQRKIPFRIQDSIVATTKYHYRNKMQVVYRYAHKELIFGFYEEGTHRVIPLTTCLVQTKIQMTIAHTVLDIMKNMKITPYDEDKRTGVIRALMIKEGFHTKELMVILITATELFPGRNEFVKRLMQKVPEVTTIVQNTNSRKTSILLGDSERVLVGKGYIEDCILENRFQIYPKSFFQINPEQTEKLYAKIISMGDFQTTDVVIDAYCGVGTIGIVVATNVKQVYGVENNKQAFLAAIQNAKFNQIKNIRFFNEDASVFLEGLAKDNESIDTIIMDPPRTGSTPVFLNSILKLKPKKIIYVSCEASTQARDIATLVKEYSIADTAIVDMFVGTYHVETITLLSLKTA